MANGQLIAPSDEDEEQLSNETLAYFGIKALGQIPHDNGEEQQRITSADTRPELYLYSYRSHHTHRLLHCTQPLHHTFPLPTQKLRGGFFFLPHTDLQYHLCGSRMADYRLLEPRHFLTLSLRGRLNLRRMPQGQQYRDNQENEQISLPVMRYLHRLALSPPSPLGLLHRQAKLHGIQGLPAVSVPLGPVDDNNSPTDLQPMIEVTYYLML